MKYHKVNNTTMAVMLIGILVMIAMPILVLDGDCTNLDIHTFEECTESNNMTWNVVLPAGIVIILLVNLVIIPLLPFKRPQEKEN